MHTGCVAALRKANSKIRSLNLGDNWFGDEGVHAVAEAPSLAQRAAALPVASICPLDKRVQVLATNSTITSLNLSDNHIGLPGVRELCRRLQVRVLCVAPLFTRRRGGHKGSRAACEPTSKSCPIGCHVCRQENGTLAEISLKGNRLDNRAATALCEALGPGLHKCPWE